MTRWGIDQILLRGCALLIGLGLLVGGLTGTAPQAPQAKTADAEWKVGLAHVKITPEQPVVMSGYSSRTKPFEKVAQDLYVKAMALEDQEGHRAVLVTADLIGFPAAVAEPICERIEKKIGLSIKAVKQDEVQKDLESYRESSGSDRLTIGDAVRAAREEAVTKEEES